MAAAKKAPGKAPKKRPGRPSVMTGPMIERICARIAKGEALHRMCEEKGMPSQASVFRALERDQAFREKYARAKELQAELYAAQIVEIADDSSKDIVIDKDGNAATDHEVVARSRLRVDARKWLASKLAPKKYGDKVQVGGADDLPPIQQESKITLSPEEAYMQMIRAGRGG